MKLARSLTVKTQLTLGQLCQMCHPSVSAAVKLCRTLKSLLGFWSNLRVFRMNCPAWLLTLPPLPIIWRCLSGISNASCSLIIWGMSFPTGQVWVCSCSKQLLPLAFLFCGWTCLLHTSGQWTLGKWVHLSGYRAPDFQGKTSYLPGASGQLKSSSDF